MPFCKRGGNLGRGSENNQCRVPDSAQMGECIRQLAAKYTKTKFVKIISNDCIPNYPDRNLPTLLIYKDGECKHNLAGKLPFGGRISPEGVPYTLLLCSLLKRSACPQNHLVAFC